MANTQWYVRYEGSGYIAGPMSKDEALDKVTTDEDSCMVFSDKIFETYHVPEDVSQMVTALLDGSSQADKVAGFVELSPEEATEIAEKLALLSRPHEVTASIRGGVFEIETIDKGVHFVVRDYDIGGTDSSELDQDDEGEDCVIQEFGP